MPDTENIRKVLAALKEHENQLVILIRVVKKSDFQHWADQYENDLEKLRSSIASLNEILDKKSH